MDELKSIKEQLGREYKYRIELHAHTKPASSCSQATPEELVKIYSDHGYHAIVIVNHFHLSYEYTRELPKEEAIDRYMEDYNRAAAAAKESGIKVLFGIELRFTENDNDYIVYGADREILSKCYDYLKKGVECYRTEVTLPDSVFVQAHPFRNGMTRCKPELLDGIETLNMHQSHNSRVGLAVRYAAENGFNIVTAGTDFHKDGIGYECTAALRTKILPNDSFELAEVLKSGDYVFEIGENAIVLP